MLTCHAHLGVLHRALKLGVRGFVSKSAEPSHIAEGIEALSRARSGSTRTSPRGASSTTARCARERRWWDGSGITYVGSDRLFNRCRACVDFEDLLTDAGFVEQFGECASNVVASDLAVELCRTEGHGAVSGTIEK